MKLAEYFDIYIDMIQLVYRYDEMIVTADWILKNIYKISSVFWYSTILWIAGWFFFKSSLRIMIVLSNVGSRIIALRFIQRIKKKKF